MAEKIKANKSVQNKKEWKKGGKMKLITFVCTLAFVSFIAVSSYAEVQNIKVGGDLQVYGVAESNLDLDSSGNQTSEATDGVQDGEYITSYVRLYLSADLTDNVAAYIRLLNERDWGDTVTTAAALPNIGVPSPITARTDLDVHLDLAYVTFKDVLGYPLTVTVGRQELLYGEGFLIADGEISTLDGSYEYDLRKSFDAIRASIDLKPFTLDLFTAKFIEGVTANTDCDLYGVNLTYDYLDQATFDVGYYAVSYYHQPNVTGSGIINANDDSYTVTVRGEGEPLPQLIPGLFLKGEVAYQWGNKVETSSQTRADRDAWGGYVGAEYLFDFLMEPYIKTNLVIMTGDETYADKKHQKFDPLFSGEVYGLIANDRDLLSLNEVTRASRSDLTGEAMTNMRIFSLGGGLKPTESLKFDLTWYNYDVQDHWMNARGTGFGDEIDIKFDYDYTEDVKLGLAIAVFNPDSTDLGVDTTKEGVSTTLAANLVQRDDAAAQVIGSMKVSF
jgi:hypothetical protein